MSIALYRKVQFELRAINAELLALITEFASQILSKIWD